MGMNRCQHSPNLSISSRNCWVCHIRAENTAQTASSRSSPPTDVLGRSSRHLNSSRRKLYQRDTISETPPPEEHPQNSGIWGTILSLEQQQRNNTFSETTSSKQHLQNDISTVKPILTKEQTKTELTFLWVSEPSSWCHHSGQSRVCWQAHSAAVAQWNSRLCTVNDSSPFIQTPATVQTLVWQK